MRIYNKKQVFKAVLLAGGASTLVMAAPAAAQNVDCEAFPNDPSCLGNAPGDRIVVTGSRISRQDYEANSPIVTVDEDFFQQSSTAAVEQTLNKLPQFVVSQSSTTSNNSENGAGLAGGDVQPSAVNTPGAATVSLRGVGSNRTLVLINGRRGVPTNASGSVDVSMIPSAALARVEIISGGASATYGADAVAGVTNFILKNDYNGIELDGQAGISQDGVGFEYQIGGIIGSDFADGRGNVSLAVSVNTREETTLDDNKFYHRLWDDPTNNVGATSWPFRTGISTQGNVPAGNFTSNYFAARGAPVPVPNSLFRFNVNPDGTLIAAGSTAYNNYLYRGTVATFKPWPGPDDGWIYKQTYLADGSLGAQFGIFTDTPLTIPQDKYNFLARGNYEINDWIGVFGDAIFSHTTTLTRADPGIITSQNDVFLPWGSDIYTGSFKWTGSIGSIATTADDVFRTYNNPYVPSSVIMAGTQYNGSAYVDPTPGNLADNPTNPAFKSQYGFLNCAGYTSNVGGCTQTEAFQQVVPADLQAALNARPLPNEDPLMIGYLPEDRATLGNTRVYQITAGLQGSVPGTDWTWEAFVSHGNSETITRFIGAASLERVRAIYTAPNFGQNFSATGNQVGGGGTRVGTGASTGTCTSGMNFFQQHVGVTQDCLDAIGAQNTTRVEARQTIAEMNVQGGLFDLWAGQLRFAAGLSYREERLSYGTETLATAGQSFNDSLIGVNPSGPMDNVGYDTKEAYGELLIPVLSDLPFIQEFSLEVGGRVSDYTTTGTSYTYKVLGDWQVNDWLRFRGGFNRAERAPNIQELQSSPQLSFITDPIGNLCSTRSFARASANPANNPDGYLDVIALCLALMQKGNGGTYVPYGDSRGFYSTVPGDPEIRQATGGSRAFAYSVGNEYYRQNVNASAPALRPETANTWTAGLVIQSPFESKLLSRLNLTVDYFNIAIKDAIGRQLTGGILLQCVNPLYNPSAEGVANGASSVNDLNTPAIRAAADAAIQNSTCPGIPFNASTGEAFQTGAIATERVLGTYTNDGEIKLSGIDANLSWGIPAGPGMINASLAANYMIHFEVKPFAGQPFIDYVGTTGVSVLGLNEGSSFRYKLFGTLGYTWGPANLSLQWSHLPRTLDDVDASYLSGVTATRSDVSGLPAYDLFALNASFQVNEVVRLRMGVDNLFDKAPPLSNYDVDLSNNSVGTLRGGNYSLFHDIQGRRFSFGANAKF